MVLLTPFIQVIKNNFPYANIDVIASNYNFQILKNNPSVSKVFVYDKKFYRILKLISTLRSTNYDYYIDPKDHFSRESSIFSKIIKAKIKIGFNKINSNNFDLGIDGMEQHQSIHFVQRLWLPLTCLGIDLPDKPIKPILVEDENSKLYVRDFLQFLNFNQKNIVCNLSASKDNKMWLKEKWIEFLLSCDLLNDNFIITCEPKHIEMAEEIVNKVKDLKLFKSRNIKDMISLLKNTDILLSPDTSLIHIAAAFNTPVITLHSGLKETYTWFKPLSDINSTIFADEGIDDIRGIAIDKVKFEFNKMLIIIHKNEKR